MNIQSLQTKIAERVRSIPLLAGLPVIEEEKGNVIKNVNEEVARSCFCVVVGALSFTDEAPDAATCYGRSTVTIHVFEDPMLNRETPERPTYLMTAQAIATELKLYDTGDGVLTSPTIGLPEDLGKGVICSTVTFSITTTL